MHCSGPKMWSTIPLFLESCLYWWWNFCKYMVLDNVWMLNCNATSSVLESKSPQSVWSPSQITNIFYITERIHVPRCLNVTSVIPIMGINFVTIIFTLLLKKHKCKYLINESGKPMWKPEGWSKFAIVANVKTRNCPLSWQIFQILPIRSTFFTLLRKKIPFYFFLDTPNPYQPPCG